MRAWRNSRIRAPMLSLDQIRHDRAAVERFAANDPYAQAGLFESTLIRPVRTAVRDGAMV